MRKLSFSFFLSLFLFLSADSFAQKEWEIARGYQVRFTTQGVEGTFTELDGDIVFSPAQLDASKFDMILYSRSIDTGMSKRDDQARGKKWLNSAYFPEITFVSDSIVQTETGFEVYGKVSLCGVERPATIPFTFKENEKGAEFSGYFSVNRKDFGIVGTTLGAMVSVGEVVRVDLWVPVVGKE
ncbi:YceI family protein [Sanyastnella coralliicola]|uniref:YceI family protein n=1 Tax=Sanyastnella coralliicola TaxID=3069118 RepID=UPI0027BAF09B|nr:YceI family protein [Longitalea sp. SCSIO 12813]